MGIGGDNPIRVQSMLTSDTRDTEACVKEALGLVAVRPTVFDMPGVVSREKQLFPYMSHVVTKRSSPV